MVQLEMSIEHHRQAALFHEAGDANQAANHGTLAFDRAAYAVNISGRAMISQAQVHRPEKKSSTLGWSRRAAAVAKKIWFARSSR
ncbi:MAG: hypothetical protein PHQ58_17285 [Rhodoferax sp.]|nr:hypothetical protein [Rhodoferax sp.]